MIRRIIESLAREKYAIEGEICLIQSIYIYIYSWIMASPKVAPEVAPAPVLTPQWSGDLPDWWRDQFKILPGELFECKCVTVFTRLTSTLTVLQHMKSCTRPITEV